MTQNTRRILIIEYTVNALIIGVCTVNRNILKQICAKKITYRSYALTYKNSFNRRRIKRRRTYINHSVGNGHVFYGLAVLECVIVNGNNGQARMRCGYIQVAVRASAYAYDFIALSREIVAVVVEQFIFQPSAFGVRPALCAKLIASEFVACWNNFLFDQNRTAHRAVLTVGKSVFGTAWRFAVVNYFSVSLFGYYGLFR